MAEHLIVVQAVEGSSPFIHPKYGKSCARPGAGVLHSLRVRPDGACDQAQPGRQLRMRTNQRFLPAGTAPPAGNRRTVGTPKCCLREFIGGLPIVH